MLNASVFFHLIHNSCICPIFWMKRQMNGSPQIPYLVEKPVLKAKQIPLGFAILVHKQTTNYQENQVRPKDNLCYVHITHVSCGCIQRPVFTLRSPSETELPPPFSIPTIWGEGRGCMHACTYGGRCQKSPLTVLPYSFRQAHLFQLPTQPH